MNSVLKDIDTPLLSEPYCFNSEPNHASGGVSRLNLYVIIELKFRLIFQVKDHEIIEWCGGKTFNHYESTLLGLLVI